MDEVARHRDLGFGSPPSPLSFFFSRCLRSRSTPLASALVPSAFSATLAPAPSPSTSGVKPWSSCHSQDRMNRLSRGSEGQIVDDPAARTPRRRKDLAVTASPRVKVGKWKESVGAQYFCWASSSLRFSVWSVPAPEKARKRKSNAVLARVSTGDRGCRSITATRGGGGR